jgi:uncharacterized damage-inducible protein DinB
MNRTLIDDYVAGGQRLRAAVAGLSDEQLKRRPADGSWSIQQIVIHLCDSDLVASDRMKRVIAEERPLLMGYDESKFAERLQCDVQSVEDAVTLFEVNRRQTGRILRALPDEAFDRWGVHNERGKVTLLELLTGYIGHLEHHLRFINRKK